MAEGKAVKKGSADTSGKKKGKKSKQTLSDFLNVPKPTQASWADSDDEEFIPREKKVEEPAFQSANTWRDSGPSGGRREEEEQAHRPFANFAQSQKPLPDRPPYTLYIGNLSYSTTEDEIAEFFGKGVESVRLVVERESGQPKGFGYVVFETRDALSRSRDKDNQSLGGRLVRLDIADSKQGQQQGRGGFGGFGDREGDREGRSGFGGGGGGFAAMSGNARDLMGSGQIERREQPPRREGGGGGGGFGGWADGGRDFMGSSAPERQPDRPDRGPREAPSFSRDGPDRGPREAPSFSRDGMGSQAPSGPSGGYSDERPQRSGFGGGGGDWSSARDAMGTGQVEQRPERPDRPERRELPSFSRDSMAQEQPSVPPQSDEPRGERGGRSGFFGGDRFGGSSVPMGRDVFGGEKAPELAPRPERPAKPEGGASWRAGEGNWRGGANKPAGESAQVDTWERGTASKPQEKEEKPKYQAPVRNTNQEEPKREKKQNKVPMTQEELFQQQLEKNKKREEFQKKVASQNNKANLNPWEMLEGASKKKNKKKTKVTDEDGWTEA